MNPDINKESTLNQHDHLRWLQVDFGGFVKAKSSEKAFTNVFSKNTNISITNTGQTDLIFYFTSSFHADNEYNIFLQPGEVRIIKIKDIPHIIWEAMMVRNENPDKEGAYFVYISNKV
jgi:hypothetical protein